MYKRARNRICFVDQYSVTKQPQTYQLVPLVSIYFLRRPASLKKNPGRLTYMTQFCKYHNETVVKRGNEKQTERRRENTISCLSLIKDI